jgi:hypothetical protein
MRRRESILVARTESFSTPGRRHGRPAFRRFALLSVAGADAHITELPTRAPDRLGLVRRALVASPVNAGRGENCRRSWQHVLSGLCRRRRRMGRLPSVGARGRQDRQARYPDELQVILHRGPAPECRTGETSTKVVDEMRRSSEVARKSTAETRRRAPSVAAPPSEQRPTRRLRSVSNASGIMTSNSNRESRSTFAPNLC